MRSTDVSRPVERLPRRRSLRTSAVMVTAAAMSFLLVALLVTTVSRSAFTATTENTGNKVTAIDLDLTDNDGRQAMFDVAGLNPDTPIERCITVTYRNDLDAVPVRLFMSNSAEGNLPQYLNLKVDIGPGVAGDFPGCTGFESSDTVYDGTLAAMPTSYGTGRVTSWDPSGDGETRTFRFRLQMQDHPDAQGESATNFGFTWETRSS